LLSAAGSHAVSRVSPVGTVYGLDTGHLDSVSNYCFQRGIIFKTEFEEMMSLANSDYAITRHSCELRV
jgi:hypothetical protein